MKINLKVYKYQFLYSVLSIIGVVLLTWNRKPAINWNPVKAFVLGFFYFYDYTERWMNGWILLLIVLTVMTCGKFIDSYPSAYKNNVWGILSSSIATIFCFGIIVLKTGGVEVDNISKIVLQVISIIWMELNLIGITCWIKCENGKCQFSDTAVNCRKWCIVTLIILGISCIPIVYAGRYVFPQADDFSYGAYAYQAVKSGEGLNGAVSAAIKTVVSNFTTWQGTFSSIFFMALQPGVWGTECYHLVPLLFVSIVILSFILFFIALLCKVCNADWEEGILVGGIASLVAVHLTVAKASAFFWYNGAVHYVLAFATTLFFISFLIFAITASNKRRIFYIAFAAMAGVMCGGGNLVSALLGMILFVGLIGSFCLFKKMQYVKILVIPGLALTGAFIANVLAPGNYVRQGKSGEYIEYGAIGSILKSFEVCFEYLFNDWMGWIWIGMIILLIPVLTKIVRRIQFDFKLPGIVLLFSYCLLSAMFTPQIYAIGSWDIGRVLNIIYFMFLILSIINEFYLIGWFEKKGFCNLNGFGCYKSIYIGILGFICAYIMMIFVADPYRITGSAAAYAIVSGSAQAYAEVVERNIDKLENSPEEDILLEIPPKEPAIFSSTEIAPWREGAAQYYGKRSTLYIE